MTLCRKGLHDLETVGVYWRRDGLGKMCRGCIKLRNVKRRAEVNKGVTRWRAEHPDRLYAQTQVWYAVRIGRLAKATHCEDCGAETTLHGHHEDYTQVLKVVWLCPRCHSARHKTCNEMIT